MGISNSGNIYFTEKTGSIRVIEKDKLNPQPLITFTAPIISQGEGGLMCIALDPNFSQNHYFYVVHSYTENSKLYNRFVRLIENNNKAYFDKILLDKILGGRIKIGPDNKLYITTGDAGNSSLSQNLSSTGWKILRIELNGSIPKDNPFANSPVYSFGNRIPQDLA